MVYYWWNDSDTPNHLMKRQPIIPSIATARAHNQSIPIYVLDVSKEHVDWHGYDTFLNFKVIRQQRHFEPCGPYSFNWKICSRIWDIPNLVKELSEDNFVFCDADIFWLKDPSPGMVNGFHVNKHGDINKINAGLWLFNKYNPETINVFSAWQKAIMEFLDGKLDQEITDVSWRLHKALSYVGDEIFVNYLNLMTKTMISPTTRYDNYNLALLFVDPPEEIAKAKSLHFPGFGKVNRLLMTFILKELRDLLMQVLDGDRFDTIFSSKPTDSYSMFEMHSPEITLRFVRSIGIEPKLFQKML
jgi:hypothetical protein